MRTTIDIPDELLRRVKSAAALRGMKLKDFVASLLADGLAIPVEEEKLGHDRPLPATIPVTGRTIAPLTNADVEEIFLQDEVERTQN